MDFLGKKEDYPPTAKNWLDRTEWVLKQLHGTPEQNLEGAVSLFQDDAYQWWDTVFREVQLDQITWDFFLTEFRKKYVSNAYLEERRREFMSLRQRQLSVAEYERECIRLSRYGREIVPIEVERCRRVEEGLNDNIKLLIIALTITDFAQLVEAALKVERGSIQTPDQGQSQRPRSQFTLRKGQSTPSVGSSLGIVYRGPAPAVSSACPHCHKWHKVECRRDTGGCFQCGSTEHQIRDCPRRTATAAPIQADKPASIAQRGRRPDKSEAVGTSQRPASESVESPETRAPTKAYAMRAQEEQDDLDVIKEMFSLHDILVYALIEKDYTENS
ncbi:uncharacterized protein LOC110659178 [Hevea brasiliensis]|uniref:uncharacterized protein LOC110659178 n=1 Tax=Hevea brasiliensis TaxID=3981 RepID=UPI0025F6998B|nr:uncharacterized protein LOC110659178 [Hevea brasiliensis]